MVDNLTQRNYLKLHLADGIGSITFGKLVDAFGSVDEACRAGRGAWQKVEGVGPKKAKAISEVTDAMIDDELALIEKHKVRLLCLEDSGYPQPLKNIYDPPAVLYVKGRLEAHDAISIGVVGARRCSYYGMEQSQRFARLLAQAGLTVISGGARGIDTAAHRGSLGVGGRTIVVSGCGLSINYPPENSELFESIIAQDKGAVISEMPMNTAVLAGNFPRRNRIISGMSLGVLIVEAALKSGSLLTARQASEQGREVFAIPGNVDSPTSMGTNKLIQDGARLVGNLDDILDCLGEVGEKMQADSPSDTPVLFDISLDDAESRIVKLLESNGPMHLDEILRSTELTANVVISKMTMLGVKSVISQQPGQVYTLRK